MSKRRKGKLARRYGHFSMKPIEDVTDGISRLAQKHPIATAGALGAGAGAIAAGMGVGTAAILGGVAGVAVEKLTK